MNPPANRRSQSRVSAKRSASTANSKAEKAATGSPEVPVAEPSSKAETATKIAPEVPVAEPSSEAETATKIAPEVPVAEPSSEAETAAKIAPEVPVAEPSSEAETAAKIAPKVPISPPSHPRQHRAIGLVLGAFEASEANINQGILRTVQGGAIETVLLGRIISLVKKHLDLAKPHLWVVYPRSRQEDDKLHFQISGVWEPETLHHQEPTAAPDIKIENGYFSIRGEVVFYSLEKEIVIVKIRQSPKKESEKPKFFKLKLKGSLPGRPLRNFWDIQAQLQEETLTIVSGTDLGPASKRKPFNKDDKKPWSKQPRKLSDGTPAPPLKPKTDSRASFERPIKKRDIQKDN